MLIAKLAMTVAGGVVFGMFAGWPVALFTIAVVSTTLTLRTMRREVEALRAGRD
jgi:uncharacterized membrane protein YdjX (TVP38/TMEM64 family)